MCCHRVILYIFFFQYFFFSFFVLWLGISRILKEPRKTIFALKTRSGFPTHSSNKAADWSLGRLQHTPCQIPTTEEYLFITIGWSVGCRFGHGCVYALCLFFSFVFVRFFFSFFYVLLPHQTTSAVSMKKMILWQPERYLIQN